MRTTNLASGWRGWAKKTVTYGLESDADISTKKFQLTFDGLTFAAHTPNGKVHVVSRLVGRINVYTFLLRLERHKR